MNEKRPLGTTLAALLLATATPAQMPLEFSVQGRLEEASQPLSGIQTLTLRLFDMSAGGSPLATEEEMVMADEHGLFLANFGDATSVDPTLFDQPLWLEVEVEGGGGPLAPRLELRAAPQALMAARAAQPASPLEIHVFHTGDDLASGAALAAEVESLPNDGRIFLVRLSTGTFDLGSGILEPSAPVILAGAGRAVTTIVSDGQGAPSGGTLTAFHDLEVRDLTIQCRGGSSNATAVLMGANDLSFTARNARLEAGAATSLARGLSGLTNSVFRLESTEVDAQAAATGTGVAIEPLMSPSTVEIRDSSLVATGGIAAQGILLPSSSSLTVDDSRITVEGSSGAPDLLGVQLASSSEAWIRGTRIVLDGGGLTGASSLGLNCAGGSAGQSSSMRVQDSEVRVLHGTSGTADGVVSSDASEVRLRHSSVLVTCSGCTGRAARATGSSASALIEVHSSEFLGSAAGSESEAGHIIRLLHSRIDAGIVGSGTTSCYGVVDSFYADGGSPSTCP